MTEHRDEVDDLPLLPSVESALRVPATDEELADAITRLGGRYSKELAAAGMSALEVEVRALELVAEALGFPVEDLWRLTYRS